jgi:hypothetical protein
MPLHVLRHKLAAMRLLLLPILWLILLSTCPAQEQLFDPQPQHPWNRLHRYFHARTAQDGKVYDHESLEPLLVPRSKFLSEGESHRQAIALLDEFLRTKADSLIDDPLKRAILQRDLWAIFVTTADSERDRQPERRELQKRLAQVVRRIALTAEQINKLPDNLTAAVNSNDFPAAFAAEHPDRPFLPADLLAPEGPVVIGKSQGRGGLAAPTHVDATDGRAAFLILLRLPGGRQATVDYLKNLSTSRLGELPQFPAGTQVALLRRMMLIDDTATLRMTPLTEMVQIRVYQDLKAPNMVEFSLARKELLAGHSGLHPTESDTVSLFDLGALGISPSGASDPLERREKAPPEITPVVMKSCIHCHAGPGIYGFQSMFVEHFDEPPLIPHHMEGQVSSTIDRVHKSYAWGLLQGLWETLRPE